MRLVKVPACVAVAVAAFVLTGCGEDNPAAFDPCEAVPENVIESLGVRAAQNWNAVATYDDFSSAPPFLQGGELHYWVVARVDGQRAIWLIDEDIWNGEFGEGFHANTAARKASTLGTDVPTLRWGLSDAEGYDDALACLDG